MKELTNNLELWNKLKAVPAAAKKKIGGGRLKGMTDIKPQWRLQMMTEQFGPIGSGWYYDIVDRWTEDYAGEVSVYISLKLYVKNGESWSMPIAGIGGSKVVAKESAGPHHSDEAYKMATTDALSVAMKQIGVAADVYMGLSDSKYDKPTEDEKPVQKFEDYKPVTNNQKEAFKSFMAEFVKINDTAAIKHLSDLMADDKMSEKKASESITAMTTYLKEKSI